MEQNQYAYRNVVSSSSTEPPGCKCSKEMVGVGFPVLELRQDGTTEGQWRLKLVARE